MPRIRISDPWGRAHECESSNTELITHWIGEIMTRYPAGRIMETDGLRIQFYPSWPGEQPDWDVDARRYGVPMMMRGTPIECIEQLITALGEYVELIRADGDHA